MKKNVYDSNLKIKVEKLRSQGKTYGEIHGLFGIPKSTLSFWVGKKFHSTFDKKAQLSHLAKIRPLALAAKNKIKEEKTIFIREKIKKEIKRTPLNNIYFQKSILAALYWAEGAKYEGVSGLIFTNTDPKLAKLYITLLRNCYNIDESKFRIRLHLHYYHNKKEAKNFWVKLLNTPSNQLKGVLIKKRSKKRRFRKNFMGICIINYLDSNIRKDLLELGNQLQQRIVENFK